MAFVWENCSLFWYKPIFLVELLLAEALLFFPFPRRNYFVFRSLGAFIFLLGISFAMPLVSVPSAGYNAFLFFFLFFCTVCAFYFCFNEPFQIVVFLCLAGYTAQHIAYVLYDAITVGSGLSVDTGSMYKMVGSTIFPPFQFPWTALIYFFDYAVVYYLAFLLFFFLIRKQEPIEIENKLALSFFAVLFLFEIVLSSYVTFYSQNHFDPFFVCVIDIFNLVACLLFLFLQYELPVRRKLKKEVEFMARMREKEKDQYQLSQRTADLISQKCHDLKFQIGLLAKKGATPKAIKEVQNAVSVYDSFVKTNNNTLNMVLTEENLQCQKMGIQMTVIADGGALSFLSDEDLYSLFGNALTNAIEAVRSLPTERKLIGMNIKTVRNFVSINIYNCFDGRISFGSNGLPLTSKGDSDYHGYGLKSIKFICEKYHGEFSIDCQRGVFNLNLLFPSPVTSTLQLEK